MKTQCTTYTQNKIKWRCYKHERLSLVTL